MQILILTWRSDISLKITIYDYYDVVANTSSRQNSDLILEHHFNESSFPDLEITFRIKSSSEEFSDEEGSQFLMFRKHNLGS